MDARGGLSRGLVEARMPGEIECHGFSITDSCSPPGAVLGAGHQGIGDRVEQLLGAAVAEMQNTLAADAIVDREGQRESREVEFASQTVALAAAHQEIGSEAARHLAHGGEIHAFPTTTLSAAAPATALRPPPDGRSLRRMRTAPARLQSRQKGGESHDQVFLAVYDGAAAEDILMSVHVRIHQPAAFLGVFLGGWAAAQFGQCGEEEIAFEHADRPAELGAGPRQIGFRENAAAVPVSAMVRPSSRLMRARPMARTLSDGSATGRGSFWLLVERGPSSVSE